MMRISCQPCNPSIEFRMRGSILGSNDQNRIEVGLKICRYAYPEAERSGGGR